MGSIIEISCDIVAVVALEVTVFLEICDGSVSTLLVFYISSGRGLNLRAEALHGHELVVEFLIGSRSLGELLQGIHGSLIFVDQALSSHNVLDVEASLAHKFHVNSSVSFLRLRSHLLPESISLCAVKGLIIHTGNDHLARPALTATTRVGIAADAEPVGTGAGKLEITRSVNDVLQFTIDIDVGLLLLLVPHSDYMVIDA